MYCVYVLKSERDGHVYIGQTEDLAKRISRHNAGHTKSIRHRIPFRLIHSELFQSRAEAMSRERYLKSLKGGNEFKKLLICWGVAKR